MVLRMLVAPLLVATAHGLNGLWQQAEAQPVESYPGSSKDCHDGLSCRACLTAGCGYYGSCLPSCDMIADVACYEGDAEKRCAAYESSQRESKLCEAASASCEVCTAKTKANGASCRWFADIGACMAEGGMIGPGESVCPQAERVHVHVAICSLVLRESWPAPGRRPFVVPQERGRYQWMVRSSCTSMKPSERGMSTEARTLWPKVDLGSETRRKRLGGGVGGARSKAVPT